MEQKADGLFFQKRRLYPPFFHIKLNDGNSLNELPGDELIYRSLGDRLFLPEDHKHLAGVSPSAASAYPLQKARDGIGAFDIDYPLEFSYIYTKFQSDRGAGDG